jgi:translocation protein SEC62
LKAKKKYTLEVHEEQMFIDGNDLYVWAYSPTKPWYYITGIIIVIGGLALSLFPVWPSQSRDIVWYLSMGGLGLLGLFFFVVILRYIIFSSVWLFTHGTHHFWFLPNLTEDVGFVDSFKPVYTFEYRGEDDDEEGEEEEEEEEEKEEEEEENKESKEEENESKEENKEDREQEGDNEKPADVEEKTKNNTVDINESGTHEIEGKPVGESKTELVET